MDKIKLYPKCLKHKHMNTVEVIREKMLISYLTQLKMHIHSVTQIEYQEM